MHHSNMELRWSKAGVSTCKEFTLKLPGNDLTEPGNRSSKENDDDEKRNIQNDRREKFSRDGEKKKRLPPSSRVNNLLSSEKRDSNPRP